jgi:hypothetical protein
MIRHLICLTLAAACAASSYAQSTSANSGTVRGSVLDPSGAAIPNATVEIQNPVSHYDQSVKTDAQGKFEVDNIPFNNYHSTALTKGFQTEEQDIDVRSPLPVEVKFILKIGESTTAVTSPKPAICSKPTPPLTPMWIADCSTNFLSKAPPPRSVPW